MSKNQESTSYTGQNILLGVLAGTVVGAIATVMINSSKAKEICDNLYDTYTDASKKISQAAQTVNEKSQDFSERFLNRRRPNDHLNMTIGAIAGGILGVTTIFFLTSDSAKSLRKQMVHSFECMSDKAHCLEDMAHSAAGSFEENLSSWVHKVNKFINTLNEKTINQARKTAEVCNEPLDKILDWAIVAAQVLQSFKK